MVPAEQQWDGPEYDGASMKAQTQEAREDPGRRDREASETFSRSRYTAFSRRRRRKEAFTEGPNEVATEFKDVGTPA